MSSVAWPGLAGAGGGSRGEGQHAGVGQQSPVGPTQKGIKNQASEPSKQAVLRLQQLDARVTVNVCLAQLSIRGPAVRPRSGPGAPPFRATACCN